MKCKYCNVELLSFTGGGAIFKGYPYHSGYYCPKCHREWSDLQISRGEHLVCDSERKKLDEEELIKHLRTPQDISNKSLEDKASTLTLHFIGFVAKPIGISNDIYEKCLEAFSNNRGKTEWEIEAVLEVLKENKNG